MRIYSECTATALIQKNISNYKQRRLSVFNDTLREFLKLIGDAIFLNLKNNSETGYSERLGFSYFINDTRSVFLISGKATERRLYCSYRKYV
jgi:hypothetical protein